ncbi:MAG: ABC transporter ATP-binding protein, partial [Calditrichaeota bacterium]
MHNKTKKMSLGSIRHAFKNIIWPRKKLVLIGIILIIINRAAGLILPGSTKFLIDDIIAEGNMTMLKWLLVVVGGALLVQSVTSFSLTRLLSVEAQHLISVLRSQMQQHIIYLPLRFFDNTKSGELVSRIMSDVEGVRNLVGTGLVQLFGGILTAIASLFLLITISPLMTVYTIVPLLIFGVISLKAFGYIRPIFRERGQINAEVTGRLTESLAGIRVIKGFNAEKFEINIFAKGVDKVFKNVKKTLTTTSFVTSLATLLMGVASITIMGVGGNMIMKGAMTVGDFFAFTLYLGFLVAPIVQMSNIGSQLT